MWELLKSQNIVLSNPLSVDAIMATQPWLVKPVPHLCVFADSVAIAYVANIIFVDGPNTLLDIVGMSPELVVSSQLVISFINISFSAFKFKYVATAFLVMKMVQKAVLISLRERLRDIRETKNSKDILLAKQNLGVLFLFIINLSSLTFWWSIGPEAEEITNLIVMRVEFTYSTMHTVFDVILSLWYAYAKMRSDSHDEDEDILEREIRISYWATFMNAMQLAIIIAGDIFVLLNLTLLLRMELHLYFGRQMVIMFFNLRSNWNYLRNLNYRTIKDLDTGVETASREDVGDDMVCSICLDTFELDTRSDEYGTMKPKILKCGHVFHLDCLKRWAARSQRCAYCSKQVLD